jgi:putative pyruvate formate lyase activating enzyme
MVSAVCAHHGEEPAISGSRGSGTVFFGNCNMRCVYCQNHQISQNPEGQEHKTMSCEALAEEMVRLQEELGCHNINFVSPAPFVPQLVRAVLEAVPLGLRVPLVYNSSGYDAVSALEALAGLVDIYMPDLRYADDLCAAEYSEAPDYVPRAREALREMHRQVGDLVVDGGGVAQRGVIVRHLVLPEGRAGSRESLAWLAQELGSGVTVSIMAQYSPQHRAMEFPALSRRISEEEYEGVLQILSDLELENGWVQERTASDHYLPDFEAEGHPFASPSGGGGQ